MDDQGGAGGVPLDDESEEARHRKPHADRPRSGAKPDQGTRAADTDEASRLDHPTEQDPADPRKHRVEWKGPDGE
ncbi:hypothetical protein ACWDYJ_35105 [Streptomyces sp. NPDC003042]